MENSALRYKIYRVLLESDLTNEQREVVLEGWFDNLKSWLGAAKDTAGTDVKKIFSNNKLNRRVKYAADNITKEIEDLKSIAKDAGVTEEAALEMLNAILKGAGADPGKIEKAAESPGTSSGGESSGSSGGTKTVDSATAAENPGVIARLLAAMSGKKGEEVASDVEEKKISAKNVLGNYVSLLSKTSGVDEAKTKKILRALMDGGHIEIGGLPEGFKNRGKNLVLGNTISRDPILERWQSLAGLVKESKATDIFKAIKDDKITDADTLENVLADKLPHPENFGVEKGGEALPDNIKEKIRAAFKKKYPDEKADGKSEDKPAEASREAGAGGFDVEAAKKEFPSAFKEVRSKLDEKEVSDEEILKVMKTIDIKDSEGAEVSIK